jgi:TctA family transporter
MNSTPELSEMNFLDYLMEAGTPGLVAFWTTFFLTAGALFGLKRRFRTTECRAYTLLASLPMVSGFYGACHLLVAFRTETGHFQSETLAYFFSSGEVAMPLMVGSFCSCALMFIASLFWMRCKEMSDDD